jgi:hypothetical protein
MAVLWTQALAGKTELTGAQYTSRHGVTITIHAKVGLLQTTRLRRCSETLMDSLIVLNCSILGDKIDRLFSIEISRTKNISMLKDAIKENQKPKLDSVTASDLDIYMVSNSVQGIRHY